MIISHNITAMGANRNLGLTEANLQKSTSKLSSGYRIRVAADDAAGLSISEKMRAQIRGLQRASENAQDGISLLQVADGAMGEVQAILQRMRELSVQAANDVNMEEDRAAIQDEIDELTKEVDHVATTTEFNKKILLDGSWANPENSNEQPLYSLEVMNGDRAGQHLTMEEVLATDGLNIIYTEIVDEFETTQTASGTSTRSGYAKLKETLQTEIVPQAVKALLETFPDTFGYLKDSSIGIGLKLDSDLSSTVLASVGIGYWKYGDGTMVKDQFSYTLTVNMAYLSLKADGTIVSNPNSKNGREALETTIVHEMVHALMDEALTNGMTGAKDGKQDSSNQFPSWFKEGMAQAAAGGCSPYNDWVNGGLGLTEASTESAISSVVKSSANSLSSGTTASQYGTGYLACMYLGYLVSGAGSVSESSIASGLDKILADIKDGKSLDTVIKENTSYKSISDFEKKFGDSESSAFIKKLVTAVGAGNGGLVGKNFTNTDLLPDESYTTNLFKLNIKNDTVTNKYPADVEKLTDGGSKGDTKDTGTGEGNGGTGGTGETGGTGDGEGGLWFQIGANEGQGIRVYIDRMDAQALGITDLSMADHDKAGEAITTLDKALKEVSRQRSLIGANHNRLEYSVRNADNSAENLQAAESRLRDLDMAEEMTVYSKSQILLQAGQSMLAQAAHSSENILQLLR